MTPRLIQVHLFRSKPRDFALESGDDPDARLLNPRRVDYFKPEPPPTQQPELFCGTRVYLGSNKSILIRETLADIKRLLK